MIKITLSLLLFVAFATLPAFAAPVEEQLITLNLPESVLAETIGQSLPIDLNTSSDSLIGSIVIQKIDNLTFGDQSISALIRLVGKDVQMSTNIGGHQLRLKIGDVLLDFAITASIRYDEATQTLFIKPIVNDIKSHGNQKNGEIGGLLVALFNGKEFPIAINKLQPIITDTGSKQLAISMHIKDVTIAGKTLVLHILPLIQTLPPPQS